MKAPSGNVKMVQIGGLLVLIMALSCLVILKSSESRERIMPGSRSFQQIFSSEWSGFARAEKDIQSLGAGQHIQGSIVTDPKDSSVVYFNADSFDAKTQKNTVNVYRYDTKTYEFIRLFKGTYGAGEFISLGKSVVPTFYVQGVDNGRLVISAEDTDFSPGPCSDPLLFKNNEVTSLISMSLENPYSGFARYSLPDNVLASAQAESEQCMKTEGLNN